MLERHEEAQILKSLAEAYKEMYEAVRADRAGQAKGKMGENDGTPMAAKAVGGGGAGNKGGMTITPVTGLGKDKSIMNDPEKDDKRIADYNKAKGVNVKPERSAKDRMGDAPTKPKRTKEQNNREATRELRRMGWGGYDTDKAK